MDGTMNALRAEAQLASMNDQIQQLEARLSAKTAHCDDLEKRNKEFDTKMRSVREEAHNVCNQWKDNAAKNKDRLTSSETARRLVEEKLVESDRIAIELKKFIDSNAKEQQGSVELLRQDKARLQAQLTLEIKKADDADRERSTMCFKFDGLQRSYLELQERLSTQTTLASTKDDTIHQLNQNIEQREQLLKNVQASLEQATAAAGNWERDCIAAVEIAVDLRLEIKKEAKDVETQIKNCQVIKEQLTTAERALEAKAGAHADAEAKITRLQTDIESFRTAKTTASEKATQLEDELSVLDLELKALESVKKDLTTKRTHDQAALKQLRGAYTALMQDDENTVSSLQAEISTLQGTISDLQEQTTHQNSLGGRSGRPVRNAGGGVQRQVLGPTAASGAVGGKSPLRGPATSSGAVGGKSPLRGPATSSGAVGGKSPLRGPATSSGPVGGKSPLRGPATSSGKVGAKSPLRGPATSSGKVGGKSPLRGPATSSGAVGGKSPLRGPATSSGAVGGKSPLRGPAPSPGPVGVRGLVIL